jgi:hypothetical protein
MRVPIALHAFLGILLSGTASAQWLTILDPAIPRLPDGKPHLSAPAPRTADGKPDLSGVWGWKPGPYTNVRATVRDEAPGWVRNLVAQRMEDLGKDDPANIGCLPQGPRMNLFPPLLAKIVQTRTLILILSEDLTYRQIFLDGRPLPRDPNPSFMGYSVGRWDGDTLVVESIGFNDRTWLDFRGHPHSEALRITERIRRTDYGHLQIDETLEDPEIYPRPWTISIAADLVPDTELLEYVCNENEKSKPHLVGKASDDSRNAVAVPPEILAKYVGTFEIRLPENPTTPQVFSIRLEGGSLFVGERRLIPLSSTTFGGAGRLEVVLDAEGAVSHLNIYTAQGVARAVRQTK